MYCSEAAVISAAVIAQRLYLHDSSLFCEQSIHKILAATLVIGAKFVDDKYYSNGYYAECTGVDVQELNLLELTVLTLLDFRVFVSEQDYVDMTDRLRAVSEPIPPKWTALLFQSITPSAEVNTQPRP
eukprot:c8932_g1_i1.p1 GENE.c8932_g1_i1~~c8932_g1_i1.p1  ORF type:complete len:128 (+),score=19.40 c8932_g1_i1:3-386(+)